jgi:hypothetical protein
MRSQELQSCSGNELDFIVFQSLQYILQSNQIGRIPEALDTNKRLFDAPSRYKTGGDGDTTGLVVRVAAGVGLRSCASTTRNLNLYG